MYPVVLCAAFDLPIDYIPGIDEEYIIIKIY